VSTAPAATPSALPANIDAAQELLARGHYVADRALATAVFLALKLKRPLFLEGEAGVGKTEIAKVLSNTLGRDLLRLQCYEGLDVAAALYEWNYARQMLEIRLAEAAPGHQGEGDRGKLAADIFSERFLIKRPLLQALEPNPRGAPVLLIDELDRTDEPFEAFLLEVLSDFQATIPEIGVVKAAEPPIVIITSNRTREIHDAIKRRCYYYWVDYPNAARELEILRLKVPAASLDLAQEVVAFVQKLRGRDLFKLPGVAETIDWADALIQLDQTTLDPEAVDNSLGALLKYQDDIAKIRGTEAAQILDEIRQEITASRLQATMRV
jgi:MoxR-like ATPase